MILSVLFFIEMGSLGKARNLELIYRWIMSWSNFNNRL
jgi:hypothetical protein